MEDIVLSKEQKMEIFLVTLRNVQFKEVSDEITISSMHSINGGTPSDESQDIQDESLCMYIPPYQQIQLLEILRDKYKCLTFDEKPYFGTEDEVNKAIAKSRAVVEYDDEASLLDMANDLSTQKTFTVKFKDNFEKIYEDFMRETDAIYKLQIKTINATPILFVNETPIRKFQDSSYTYRMMELALGLPNKSEVPVKTMLKDNRGDRGCPQDLADIFKSSALKLAFTSNVKKNSFVINHMITKADLSKNKAFQELVRKDSELSDTTYLAKEIEKCRISL